MARQNPAPAATAGTGAPARSRVPGNREAYLVGAIVLVGAGLALLQRRKAKAAAATAPANAGSMPSDTTYDTSVMDAYNQLQAEYDQLADKVQGLSLPTSSGTKGPPPPVPTPVPGPPVRPPGPIPGPHPPVPVPIPKPPVAGPPSPPPPKPPTPAQRTQIVGHWPNWDGSLFGIAQHWYGNGNSWQRIYQANRSLIGNNPDNIQPGMKLVIP